MERSSIMTKKAVEFENRIQLRGTIVNVRNTDKCLIYILAARTDRKTGNSSNPQVFVRKDAGFPIYKKGDTINVLAHLATKRKQQPDGKKVYIKTIFADDISLCTRRLVREGVDCEDRFNGGLEDDINRFLFAGEFVRTYEPFPGMLVYTLMIKRINELGREEIAYADISCYRNGIMALNGAKPGDFIAAAGYVRAKYRPEKGRILTSYIARDVELFARE